MMQCQTSGCHGLSGAICTGAGQWIQFCPICKTKQAIQPPRQPDEADGLAAHALVYLQRCNYAAAEKGFLDAAGKAAQDAPRQAFYLWCSLIARYGVEYVQEVQFESIPARRSCLFVPTFGRFPLPDHRIMETEACRQLDMLLFGMPGVDVGSHLRELDILIQEIEDCCRDRKSQYNVFIAWHDRADDGHGPCRTFADRLNSYLNAQRDCYSFVSFRSLHDVIVDHYEPHIYTALASARVMVIVVDDLDAMQRKFLRSEINRFLIRRAANHKLHIYLCCMQGATGTPPTMMAGWQRRNGCENTDVWYELVTKDVMERLRDDTPAPKPEPVPQPEPPKPEPVPQPVPKPEPEPAPEAEQKKQKKIDWKNVLSTAYKVLKPIISNFFIKKDDVTGATKVRKRGLLSSITAILLCISQVVSGVVMPDGAESGQGFSALIGWVKQGWVSVFGEKGEEEKAEKTDDSTASVSEPLPTTFSYGDFDVSHEEDGLVIKKYTGDETTVEIPSQINGMPVVAIGDGAFQNCRELASVTIPDGITSIGNDAFFWCDHLINISIPKNTTFIGDGAFSYIAESAIIMVAPGNTVFAVENDVLIDRQQKKLLWYRRGHSATSYQISESVTTIGDRAFMGCKNLTSITIPDSVTSIGDYAFQSCSNITSITIPDSVTSIGDGTFSYIAESAIIMVAPGNTVFAVEDDVLIDRQQKKLLWYRRGHSATSYQISESVTTIGDCAFSDCKNLTSITIPDSVTSIGDSAFSFCSNLISITIPDSVTSIGDRAFQSCSNITNITIPDSVTSIGDYAFESCSDLTSITIPDGVTSIGDFAFSFCSNLTSITIPDSVTSIGDRAFQSCSNITSIIIPNGVLSIGNAAFSNCENLTSITIPDSVTSIGDGTFSSIAESAIIMVAPGNTIFAVEDDVLIDRQQKKLLWYRRGHSATSYQISESVTTIGDSAFSGCKNLTSITIPDSVTSIGDGAFQSCSGLTSITIPDGVTSIGDFAFSYCSNLISITIPDSVTSIGDRAFQSCSNITNITIPDGVTSIGDFAFSYCSNLTSITIPDSVTSIGDCAFQSCSNLTSITIPDTVPSIGVRAFYRCAGLTSIFIPRSVVFIGEDAFSYCPNLTFTVPSGSYAETYAKENDIPYQYQNTTDAGTQALTDAAKHYERGEQLLAEGKFGEALLSYRKAVNHPQAKGKAEILQSNFNGSLAVGYRGCFLGLLPDGTVTAITNNEAIINEVEKWSDIIAISIGTSHAVALKSNGTVVTAGTNDYGRCDVSHWNNIISVAAGDNHTVGLKSDGTVVAVGYNDFGPCSVQDWKNVKAIDAGSIFTVGLLTDGTVIAVGHDSSEDPEVYSASTPLNTTDVANVVGWSDMITIDAGGYNTAGIDSSGTVTITGSLFDGKSKAITDWTDIVAISAGNHHVVGLRSDGTVLAIGDNSDGQCDVSDWSDIVAVNANGDTTIGLNADGNVIVTGTTEMAKTTPIMSNIGPNTAYLQSILQ